jgi:hypothetical protein
MSVPWRGSGSLSGSRLSNVLRLEGYAQDAERDGDNDLADFCASASPADPAQIRRYRGSRSRGRLSS